jgi:F-type H+-transporting ATPase subunit b
MGALLSPAFGTVIWASIAFIVVLLLMRRMAWGPILKALSDREESITAALNEADKARQEMAALSDENERLLKEARKERDSILAEARETATQMVAEARAKAQAEADRDLANARDAIAVERKAAVAELKAEVASLSIDIAERLMRQQLERNDEQQQLVNKLIDESPLN